MARLTVEDCLDNVENRFELVLVAAQRARQLAMGAEPLVPLDNDKPTVLALREIAENLINKAILEAPEETPMEDIEAMIEGDLSIELENSLKDSLNDTLKDSLNGDLKDGPKDGLKDESKGDLQG